jgi:hypothetical protein
MDGIFLRKKNYEWTQLFDSLEFQGSLPKVQLKSKSFVASN